MPDRRQCQHVRPDGRPCRAYATTGSSHCFFHAAELAEQRQDAQRRGGVSANPPRPSTLPVDTPPLRLESVEDVREALAEAYNHCRTGRIGVNVANALGQLGGQLIKALEGSDLERRLAALEGRQQSPLNGRAHR